MEHHLNDTIEEVEILRQAQSRQSNLFKLGMGLGAAIILVALSMLTKGLGLQAYLFYFLSGIGIIVVCYFAMVNNNARFLTSFRNKLLKSHIAREFPNTTYTESYIPESVFLEAQMVATTYSKYTGEDLISSQIAGCKVEICQLRLTFQNNKAYLLSFGGEFAVIKATNFNISTDVLIDYKNPYPQLGNLLGLTASKSKMGKTKVAINSEIDSLFNTYAQDDLRVNQVLSPDFLSWWEKNAPKEQISLYLSSNTIYIGWHKGEKGDFLALDIHQPVTAQTLARLSDEIRQKFSFMEQLLSFFPPVVNQ